MAIREGSTRHFEGDGTSLGQRIWDDLSDRPEVDEMSRLEFGGLEQRPAGGSGTDGAGDARSPAPTGDESPADSGMTEDRLG